MIKGLANLAGLPVVFLPGSRWEETREREQPLSLNLSADQWLGEREKILGGQTFGNRKP